MLIFVGKFDVNARNLSSSTLTAYVILHISLIIHYPFVP